MPFLRSAVANTNNKLGLPRAPLNQITSFLDSSNVYSSTSALCKTDPIKPTDETLRDFTGGKLKVQENSKLMPPAKYQKDCNSGSGNKCFLAGDIRNSEHMGLASLQTFWVREHNYIAEQLQRNSKVADDEALFLEARKIVNALQQRITYKEFLPLVIGEPLMEEFKISEKDSDYFTDYNDTCDALFSTEFATAAYRFGHSLVNNMLLVKSSNQTSANYSLLHHFMDPDFLYNNQNNEDIVRAMLFGATKQETQKNDRLMSSVIRDHLFETVSDPNGGFDLAALNIQRGRDHGLKSYAHYRKHFTGEPIMTDFDQLLEKNIMTDETVTRLKDIYKNVQDIDLWTGIVSEIPVAEGIVGVVGAHIIGEQFKRLKHCDRFFYSNRNNPTTGVNSQFTSDQLKEIRKPTLASILCRGAESDSTVRYYPFRELSCFGRNTQNCENPCSEYKPYQIDFDHWNNWKPNLDSSSFKSYSYDANNMRCIYSKDDDFGVKYE